MLPTIYATSPLHNVNTDPDVDYPAVLVTTGDHDTRVIPGHSLKYLAELQCESRTCLLG
jgi:prolyl oligopeptidase